MCWARAHRYWLLGVLILVLGCGGRSTFVEGVPTLPPPTAAVAIPTRLAPLSQPTFVKRGPPPTPLHASLEPSNAAFDPGQQVHIWLVVTNLLDGDVRISGVLRPTVAHRGGPSNQNWQICSGADEVIVIPAHGAYRREITWDQRLDDGSQTSDGIYAVSFGTVLLDFPDFDGSRHTTYTGLGAGYFILRPAAGFRTGVIPLNQTSRGTDVTITLDRLTLREDGAKLEGHAEPVLGPQPGTPPDPRRLQNRFRGEFRFDGTARGQTGESGRLADPSRFFFTFELEPVPTTVQRLAVTLTSPNETGAIFQFNVDLP